MVARPAEEALMRSELLETVEAGNVLVLGDPTRRKRHVGPALSCELQLLHPEANASS